jgi:hypothetical protein
VDLITSRTRARFQSLWERDKPRIYGNDGLLLPEIAVLPKKEIDLFSFINAGTIEVRVVLHEGFILFIPNAQGAASRFFRNVAEFSVLAGPVVAVAALVGVVATSAIKGATEPTIKDFQQITDELVYAKYQRHLNEIIIVDRQNILTLDIQQSRKGLFGGEKSAGLQVKVKGSFQTFGHLRPDEVSFHILEKHSSLMARFSREGLGPTASAV